MCYYYKMCAYSTPRTLLEIFLSISNVFYIESQLLTSTACHQGARKIPERSYGDSRSSDCNTLHLERVSAVGKFCNALGMAGKCKTFSVGERQITKVET